MADNRLPCFLVGLGLGATLGLLVAPKPGRQLRADLCEGAEEGRDYIVRTSGELRERAESAVGKGKQAVEEQRDQLQAALQAGVQAYRKALGGDWVGGSER